VIRLICISALVLLCLGKSGNLYGQVTQPYRYEQNIKNQNIDFTVISFGKNGLCLIQDLHTFEKTNKKWQVAVLDTTLAPVWAAEFGVPARDVLAGFEYNSEYLYLLYRDGNTDFSDFNLLIINLNEKTIQNHVIKFEVELALTHFTVAGQSAVFGGYVNREPAVLLYDPLTHQSKILAGFFVKGIEILDVRANQNQSFNVLLINRNLKFLKKLILRNFDPLGKLILEDEISIPEEINIISGMTTSLVRDELLIAGTYSSTDRSTSVGIYSVNVNPFENQKINFTTYSSLYNFLNFLPPKHAERVKSQDIRRKEKGLLPIFKVYVNPIKILESPNGFYLLTEVYSPRDFYDTSNNPFFRDQSNFFYPFNTPHYGYYSPRYNTLKKNYDMKMIQASIIKINSNAIPTRDISIPLENISRFNLRQVSDFTVVKDSIDIAFKIKNKIYFNTYKSILNNNYSLSDTTLVSLAKLEKIRNELDDEGNILHWFNDSFYTWGYQSIDSYINNTKESRPVFYINRLRFR